MADAFYRLLIACSRSVGLWIVRAAAAVIATGYFVLLPRRLAHSVRTYRALFPERGWTYALGCAWRQYQDFASIYTERLEVEQGTRIHYEHEGAAHLAGLPNENRGAVLLMSHFGRWQLSARMLPRDLGRLVVVMGARQDAAAESVPAALLQGGVDVRATPEAQANAAGIFDAVQALRDGALVSMAADRAWGASRTMSLPFLGHRIAINVAPFALALATGAPLFVVFAYKVARRHYRFVCSAARHVRAASRAERDAALREQATAYLDDLASMMRAHPEQWHAFGPFLLEREES